MKILYKKKKNCQSHRSQPSNYTRRNTTVTKTYNILYYNTVYYRYLKHWYLKVSSFIKHVLWTRYIHIFIPPLFITKYWYIKVNFLRPENLLWYIWVCDEFRVWNIECWQYTHNKREVIPIISGVSVIVLQTELKNILNIPSGKS